MFKFYSFVLVFCVAKYKDFILFHLDIWFSKHHLSKRLSFIVEGHLAIYV